MNDYVLGIDGGATKTLARLEYADRELRTLHADGSSLTQDLAGALINITGICRQMLAKHRLAPRQVTVACGIAGAGNPTAAKQLRQRLQELNFARVLVTSDAQTSLLGAGAGTPIVMVAVGTGSVAMRLGRDGNVRQFGGWGLAVGDEGSGAAIGKSAVRALLWELDMYGRAQSRLSQNIMPVVGKERAAILPWLQSAGSKEYAALAPAVFACLQDCSLAKDIIIKTAGEVDRLITAASEDEPLPLAMLGGLADKLSPFLHPDHQQRQIPPLGSALDGACLLAKNSIRDLTPQT